ncbi:MAG: DMT family transporter [Deltaproteobacteria bacterium]|nr:DMT family transporter [Deltaproteobacteria bacterium]
MAYRSQLQWQPVVIMLCLATLWGANMAAIKIASREMAPLFMAGLRSLVAGCCLYVWLRLKGIPLFPSRAIFFHGAMTGLLFGAEFGCVYVGLQHTLASRTYILLHTAPFFVALEAHFLLQGDRLSPWKIAGLVLAFSGVVSLFVRDIGSFSLAALPGDLLALLAGFFWGSTTVYIKRFLAHRAVPLQTLFYQVAFSAPFLFLLSLGSGETPVTGFSALTAGAVLYQCVVVAFLSYLVWFHLIHRYPVSLLHGFTFLTPVIGVFLSGAIILGELIQPELIVALVLVSAGLIVVNRSPGEEPGA